MSIMMILQIIVMVSIIIMSVLGNLLVRSFVMWELSSDQSLIQVLISVTCNRTLRQPPNLLLLSLAVTDMLVSLLVMPGALMQHLTGYWPGEAWLCLAWVFSDVFLCTSSILSLTAICIGESLHSHFTVTSQCHENNTSSKIGHSHITDENNIDFSSWKHVYLNLHDIPVQCQ